ncbi:hypothetical protein CCZ01_09195 [Helicobacter monodelphidis]|uniref:hypothetical protein n=1 Tax=Helicobacter sp. 15-1451 TaxID=2004995 RepID=UPI000DCC1B96|nr:hypothetical protein [Helicobacter sp. 15-1451]RAX56539.1 hypothetical protein CCZ01_09195 [Helicobacter sp. 15-1451]
MTIKLFLLFFSFCSLSFACVKVPCEFAELPFEQKLKSVIEQEYSHLDASIEHLKEQYEKYLAELKKSNEDLKKLESSLRESNLQDREMIFLQHKFNQLLSKDIEWRLQ